jgi:hypothetical protein
MLSQHQGGREILAKRHKRQDENVTIEEVRKFKKLGAAEARVVRLFLMYLVFTCAECAQVNVVYLN